MQADADRRGAERCGGMVAASRCPRLQWAGLRVIAVDAAGADVMS